MLKWQQLTTLETREGDESSTQLSGPSSVSHTRAHTHARCQVWCKGRTMRVAALPEPGNKWTRLKRRPELKSVSFRRRTRRLVRVLVWLRNIPLSRCLEVAQLVRFNFQQHSGRCIRIYNIPESRFVRPTNLISGFPYKRAIGIAIVAAPRPEVTDPETLNVCWEVFIAWYAVHINGQSHSLKSCLQMRYYNSFR